MTARWRAGVGLALALSAAAGGAQEKQKPQVLFSGRPAAEKAQAAGAEKVTDAERRAVVVTGWDLDVHLEARNAGLEAHARVTVRNAGSGAIAVVPLQISSSLKFEQVGLGGKRLGFAQSLVASDADHTGELEEAAIRLPEALGAGRSLTLDVDYGGTIARSAQRLTAIGAPQAEAEASDWDRIGEEFTGLRGFGNVVWYPVSGVPVSMGQGAQLFTEIGRQKLLDQDASVRLRVTEEFYGDAPTAAVLDGRYVALKTAAMPTVTFPGVVTAEVATERLGFEVPSIFVARRTAVEGNGVRVLAMAGDVGEAQGYVTAGSLVGPLVRSWLGTGGSGGGAAAYSGSQVSSLAGPGAGAGAAGGGEGSRAGLGQEFTVLELPEADDAAAETGALLAAPLSGAGAEKLAGMVAHGLAHAAFFSPRGWLNEGVANFVGTLWVESSQGPTAAVEWMNAGRPALALAEPASPGQGSGEDLLHAVSAVYYRTKATYVLWMLRQIVGEKALESALQAYDPGKDTTADYFEQVVEQASGKDLHWFFASWVNEDRGLPDLSIAGVYPTAEAHQQVLVAVEIANAGYAEAAVPVTVKGIKAVSREMVRVPARGRVTYRVTFQEQPVEVDVNDGSVPEVQDSLHEMTIR